MRMLRAFVLAFPALLPLSLLGTWCAGRLALGHWPRPSLDDPKLISPWVDIPYGITEALMMLGFPLFIAGVLELLGCAWRNRPERRRHVLTVIVSVAALIASIALLRWDPLQIVNWYTD